MNKTPRKESKHIDHPLNLSRSKTAYSFRKSERFIEQKNFSPNKFYDHPSTLSHRKSSIGFGNKVNFQKQTFIEPTRYKIVSQFDKISNRKGKVTTFGINRQQFYKGKQFKNGVGPGAYEIASPIQTATRSIYIGTKIEPKMPNYNASVASYQIKDEKINKLSIYQNAQKGYKMKADYYPKPLLKQNDNKIPGPGAYIINREALRSQNLAYLAKTKEQRWINFQKQGQAVSKNHLTQQYIFLVRYSLINLGSLIQISFSTFFIYLQNITNMYEEQQEQVKDPDADLPPFKVRHNDMKLPNVKLIVRKATEFIKEESKKPDHMLEKEICLKLVEYLRSNKADFGSGDGEWQCIIGKNLAATLNYDLHQLTFLDLTEFGYSILVFKSG